MVFTNFQKVKQFMSAFGQSTFDTPQPELYTNNKLFNFRLSLIEEEFKEIIEAIKQNDFVEFVDGIADLLVVTYGTGLAYGINLDNADNITNFEAISKMAVTVELYTKFSEGSIDLINRLIGEIDCEIDKIKINKHNYNYNNDLDKFFCEFANGLKAIIQLTYKMGITYGIDVDDAFDIVHKSNMSKLCVSEEEAKQTVEWYLKNEPRYPSPSYKQASDGSNWIVYEQTSGKVLKSINYTPADLKKFGQ